MKKKHNARSIAAIKGWRTRRANEHERSERSRKGWETRRRNERAAARAKKQRAKRAVALKPSAALPVWEWVVTFEYTLSGRSFDVIVTARDEIASYPIALDFLWNEPSGRGRQIMIGPRRLKKNWHITSSRGRKTRRDVGHAEYRDKSRRK